MKITLVPPSSVYKDSFLLGVREFRDEKILWALDLDLHFIENNFSVFIEKELHKKTHWTKDTPVDETELWAIHDDTYVGHISIRHSLNEDLKVMGGHIGYDTRPSFRGKQIASQMLTQALPIAKKLGLKKVLLTCNDDNIPSIKVIEKNGGILFERKKQSPQGPLKRYYWIAL